MSPKFAAAQTVTRNLWGDADSTTGGPTKEASEAETGEGGLEPIAPEGILVVARVNGQPIYLAEVHRYLHRLPTTEDESLSLDEPNALAILIQRQVVLQYLLRKRVVTPDEIQAQLDRRRKELADHNQLLDPVCEEMGIRVDALQRSVGWNIAWPRYLAKHLNGKRLRQYYDSHQAHFDGGSRVVSHILWELPDASGSGIDPDKWRRQRDHLLVHAKSVRDQIIAGKLRFDDAARTESAGPSAQVGGDLGSIERDGPMSELFSKAAFDLKLSEVGQPVVDRFGVHLIQCRSIEPGNRKFSHVRLEVERAARSELFRTLAKRNSKNVRVELLGRILVDPASLQQLLPGCRMESPPSES